MIWEILSLSRISQITAKNLSIQSDKMLFEEIKGMTDPLQQIREPLGILKLLSFRHLSRSQK